MPFAEATHSMLWAPRDSESFREPRWMSDAFWIGLPRGVWFYGNTPQEAIDQLAVALDARSAEDAACGIVCDQCSAAIADLDQGALRWSTDAERTVTRFNVLHVSCTGPDFEFEVDLSRARMDSHRLLTEISWPDDLRDSVERKLALRSR